MNLPNKLTIFRVVLIPFFLFFYFWSKIEYHMYIAFSIFVVASLTDLLDGKIARKYNLVTNFGKLMDPLADKLLVTAAMVCILSQNYCGEIFALFFPLGEQQGQMLSVLVLITILSRDLIVTSIRLVAAGEGIVIAADIYGKIKTVLQMGWLSVALLYMGFMSAGMSLPLAFYNGVRIIELILFVGMTFMTVASGLNYVVKNKSVFADG